MIIKTGEVYDRDKDGFWLCESWLNEATGEVTATRTLVENNEKEGIIIPNEISHQ